MFYFFLFSLFRPDRSRESWSKYKKRGFLTTHSPPRQVLPIWTPIALDLPFQKNTDLYFHATQLFEAYLWLCIKYENSKIENWNNLCTQKRTPLNGKESLSKMNSIRFLFISSFPFTICAVTCIFYCLVLSPNFDNNYYTDIKKHIIYM